jgi:hypothetical protein
MGITIDKIKPLTKKLALISLKNYDSLSEAKDDFDEISLEFINLDSDDTELVEVLKRAANFFNLLNPDDFETNDRQQINESKAVISRYSKELNSILVQWRKELGFQ